MRLLLCILAGAGIAVPLTCVAGAAPAAARPSLEQLASQRLGLSRLALEHVSLASRPEQASIALDLNGERVTVHVHRQSLRSQGFKLLVQGADGTVNEVVPPAPSTYRGTVDGHPGSVVAATIDDGLLRATIALDDGRVFYVEPLNGVTAGSGEPLASDRSLHVVYRSDAVQPSGGTCAADETPVAVPSLGIGNNATTPAAPLATYKVADIAFDADVEFFKKNKSSVDSTVKDIEGVLAGVNAVYERDCGITHHVAMILVRSVEPDPFTAMAAESLLTQLRSDWNNNRPSVNRDIVHLMTGRDLTGNVVGYSNVGTICSVTRSYGLSASRYTSNYAERTTLTAHELGHNWNAGHCNAYSPCNIMCSAIDGCDGMGLPNFEPTGRNAIMSYAATRSCLGTFSDVGDSPLATDIRLESPWPSPLQGQTSLRYYLDQDAPGRLDIVDLAGRRVVRLADGVQQHGWHTVTWDGSDAHGRRVAPGTLFVRFESGASALTRKLVIIQ